MRQCPLIVLKFGSSVLRTESDLPRVVHEIYRWVRDGYRVLAVVSAFESKTNQLFEQARRYSDSPHEASVAALVATGEATSAALLSLVLDRAGLHSILLDSNRVGLRTRGPLLDADPYAVNCGAIDAIFEDHSVAVLPGFVGRSETGCISLLGRGGSDLTALFLAKQLKAERCRLIKDVDGLFDRDPAHEITKAKANRYRTITWNDSLELNADVVQRKSIVFAQENQFAFEVAGLGSDEGTLVGAPESSFHWDVDPAATPLRVGLLGLGTVGFGVFRALASQPHLFEVTKIAVRKITDRAEQPVPDHLLTRAGWEVIESDCDVVIELIGGCDPATDLIEAALARGKHVITANKKVIAESGTQLHSLADLSGARLCYSAAVGGAVPMLEAVQRLTEASKIISLRGVVNGTTTFVLNELAKGVAFDEALLSARACGLAEADATLDLNGTDAAHKLVLLTRTAFGIDLEQSEIDTTGIFGITPEDVQSHAAAGQVVRLVASADFVGHRVSARVRPTVLSADDPLAKTQGAECCLVIGREGESDVVLRGKGAGRWPTTESVMADLFSLLRTSRIPAASSTNQELTFAGGVQ